MKTIAVFTDYSEQSAHAARFALHLAKKIKANVLLYNLCMVASKKQLQPQLAWAEADFEEEKNLTQRNNLEAFCTELENELKLNSFPGAYLPEISYEYCDTEIVDVMTSVIDNKSIAFIVIATQSEDDIGTFMMRENCQKIIDWSTVPVLIVPENTAIHNPEKIAFAANLDANDTDYINMLTAITQQFSPEIMVTHINMDSSQNEYETAENLLIKNICYKVNYGRIYYRSTSTNNIKNGWEWLNKNKKCDLLAMVQQPKFVLKEFFKIASTSQLTYHLTIPILVFPAII